MKVQWYCPPEVGALFVLINASAATTVRPVSGICSDGGSHSEAISPMTVKSERLPTRANR